MVKFNLFVLPFCIGIAFLVVFLVVRFTGWIKKLSEDDQLRFRKGIFSVKLFSAAREIVMESLLHRRIFMRNIVLGYMHMSFAFGWFMLILIGNIEARFYARTEVNPPYYPIFLKFFVHDKSSIPYDLYFLNGFFLTISLIRFGTCNDKTLFFQCFWNEKDHKVKTCR
jgi:hypothetical protein